MFPARSFASACISGFPHAGGDVSTCDKQNMIDKRFSPRRWGCFCLGLSHHTQDHVFPTQVGMFLTTGGKTIGFLCFPHAGGDVSAIYDAVTKDDEVFPTQVGMFLPVSLALKVKFGFPHAGGDVSILSKLFPVAVPFSPRRWGCFSTLEQYALPVLVFPTQVGMFPLI